MSDLSESYQDVIGATAKPTRAQTEDLDTKPDVLSAEKDEPCDHQFTGRTSLQKESTSRNTTAGSWEAMALEVQGKIKVGFETELKSQKSGTNINDTQSDANLRVQDGTTLETQQDKETKVKNKNVSGAIQNEKIETLCENINMIFGEVENVMTQFIGDSLDLIESAKAEALSCVRNTLRNEHWEEKDDLRQQLNDVVNSELGLQTQPLQSDAENRKPKDMEATIENNLKRYKQYIFECVKVTDLIAFYDLFTVTQTNRFRSMYRNYPVEATEMAFDEIFAMQNQPDKYKCLLSALKDAGYSKVVQILQGVLKPVGSIHKKLLRSCSKDLFHQLSIKDVLPHLYKKEIISLDDMQQIIQTERTEGNGSAVLHLLCLLPNKHEHWFKHFVESLNESSQTHLVEALTSNDMHIQEEWSCQREKDYY